MAAMCPLCDREKSRLLASKDTVARLRIAIGSLTTIARSTREEVAAEDESEDISEAEPEAEAEVELEGSTTPVPQLGRRPSR